MGWIRRIALALLAMALVFVVALALYRQKVLPVVQGTVAISGLAAKVTIERDADGVPTIRAANLNDLMFGLGLVHAQDRLWQLETHRRIGAGQLAEAFGEPALESDKFLRALGVRRAAQAQWERLPPASKALVSAYTQGINAWVAEHLAARPPEFLLLRLPATRWTEVDSLAWAIMMAWDLGGNWGSELMRMRLALNLPMARVHELMPPYPGDAAPAMADIPALYRELKLGPALKQALVDLPRLAPESGIEGAGSNNWVVAGSRSETGRPLLANDPHLKLSAPALWYFARLEAPGYKLAGATLPGLPGVVLGQNMHLAWGFTNTGPDVQDLYLERVSPQDSKLYQTQDGWAPFEAVQEVIKVRGKPDVLMTARRTRHGPVISDAGTTTEVLGSSPYVLAMRWTALDADVDAIGPALRMNAAKTVEEFVAATRAWVAPMQNMVVADTQGRIGFVAAGRVPLRRHDNDLKGLAPAPGWDARYDWAGWLDADATPREFDPQRGWLATANQRIHAVDYPHHISSDWAAPYRQQRIEQLLQARPKHSMTSLAAMHKDVFSLAAKPLLPWLTKAASAHPLAAAAQQQLQGFEGDMVADKAAPLIYWAWARQLTRLVFADDIGPALYDRVIGGRSFRDALEGVLARNDAWWCDDQSTPARETCVQLNDRAFTLALEELQARHGADPTRWRWGAAHVARSEHRPFSKVKPLARLFETRTPVGGDTYTVNVSRVSLKPDATTGELYLDEHGPSLRALYDLGDLSQSRVMHSTGQSGIPLSAHYRRWVRPWAAGDYVPLWGTDKPEAVLTLNPR
jgi:penicillin G amidase